MDRSSRIVIEPGDRPGVTRTIRHLDHPELVLACLTADAWEERTGVGNHVSFGAPMPVTLPASTPAAGGSGSEDVG